jgi:hypothetical protein
MDQVGAQTGVHSPPSDYLDARDGGWTGRGQKLEGAASLPHQ